MNEKINEILGLLAENRPGAAVDALNALCESEPDNYYPRFLLGAAYGMTGNYARSLECCNEAIRLNPACADAHYNLSQALIELGRLDDAIRSLRNCLRIDNSNRKALLSLLALLIRTGDSRVAEQLALSRLQAAEPDPGLAREFVEALLDQQKNDAAAAYLDTISTLTAQSAKLNALRAVIAFRQQDYATALEYYANAHRLAPADHAYPVSIALIHLAMGDYRRSEQYFLAALSICPDDARARSAYLFSLNYYRQDGDAVARLHSKLMAQPGENAAGDCRMPARRRGGGRVRVGYISPDFRRHSVAFFIEPVIQRHDREGFEVFCYSLVNRPDETTRRIRDYADHWREIPGLPAAAVREAVVDDGIDILVDLAGHTSHETLPVFSPRAAPVQVTYLGYPNTTGLQTMDYRLSDRWADPPGTVPGACTEAMVRLDCGFLCYRAPQEARDLALAVRGEGPVTFGSFNNFSKITPEVIGCWVQILLREPDTRLVIKNKALGNAGLRSRLVEEFSTAGVDAARLTLLGHVNSRAAHLEMYYGIDIALDTFPYNGTTTTCESLWMGVPVITLAGSVHASRVGSSLIHRLGLNGFIARDVSEYIECAVKLSRDRERLRELRCTLRECMLASPLCDERGFVANLEQAYQDMLSAGVQQ